MVGKINLWKKFQKVINFTLETSGQKCVIVVTIKYLQSSLIADYKYTLMFS